jgi:hypothetical protein
MHNKREMHFVALENNKTIAVGHLCENQLQRYQECIVLLSGQIVHLSCAESNAAQIKP